MLQDSWLSIDLGSVILDRNVLGEGLSNGAKLTSSQFCCAVVHVCNNCVIKINPPPLLLFLCITGRAATTVSANSRHERRKAK